MESLWEEIEPTASVQSERPPFPEAQDSGGVRTCGDWSSETFSGIMLKIGLDPGGGRQACYAATVVCGLGRVVTYWVEH